jgi:DNA polymerase elongation subunit (family B)
VDEAKPDGGLKPQQLEVELPGRIVLDIWQVLKQDLALGNYSYEACVFHVLHKRVPHYSAEGELSLCWV